MENKNKRKLIYSLVLVLAIVLSVLSTSVYYKVFYASSSDGILLDKVYQELYGNYYKEVNKEVLYEGAVKGMVEALDDPYSTYMNPEETEQFKLMLENQFVGIGVQVEKAPAGVYITKVFDNSPAEKAGLTEGDVFSEVDGKKVAKMEVDELVTLVRGPKGSEVEIKVKRAGEKEDLTYKVKRDEIELEDLTYGIIGESNDIGYIKINDFTGDIYSQFESAYKELNAKNIKSLIIDVRDNGGGYLDQVLAIVDMFVDDSKPIYQEKVRDKVTNEVYGDKKKEKIDIAVLINENSASASELLAASLSEINGCKLIGVTSYGKGTAQTTKEYSNKSSLKYTYAQWLTPNGNWINEVGVEPDYKEELNEIFFYNKVLVSEAISVDTVNPQVANAQLILKAMGYTTRVDGYFGNDTKSAIETFQTDKGIKATGVLDSETANKINESFEKFLKDYKKDNQIMKAIEVLGNE